FFLYTYTSTTLLYTLSLHDALPIFNRRAMELLRAGGILVTCSCSYNLTEWDFLEVLREAANDARSEFRVVERRTQAADHPILLRSEEHTSELQSRVDLVCRLLLEKK